MKNTPWVARLLLVGAMLFGIPAIAQSFSVTQRTSSAEILSRKDSTIQLKFRVNLTGASGSLSNVVPELVIPTCAVENGLSLISASYQGYLVGTTITPGPIPTWDNSSSREVSFAVHFYDNSTFCEGATTVCPNDLEFEVRFTHSSQTAPVQASDPTNQLRLLAPPEGGFRVIDQTSESALGTCGSYDALTIDLLLNSLAFDNSLLSDPSTRVFLGVNWNLNFRQLGLAPQQGIGSMLVPLSQTQSFPLVARVFQGTLTELPPGTVVYKENGETFNLALFGGDGTAGQLNCDLETWNLFDITTQTTTSGTPVKNAVGTFSNRSITITRADTLIDFRKAAVFLATEGGCLDPTAFAFGTAPPTGEFQISQLDIEENGQAQISLKVPAAWRTGNQLRNGYVVEWYIRNFQTFSRATMPGGGTTPLRNLSTTIQVPTGDPSNFFIEARITHNSTGGVVSTTSPRHGLSYDLNLGGDFFFNAEQPQDIYLDEGETYAVPLDVINVAGKTLSNVTVEMNVVTPSGASVGFEARPLTDLRGTASTVVFQDAITSGGRADLELFSELLCFDLECDDLTVNFKASYEDSGFSTSFQRSFTVPANCQFVPQTSPITAAYTELDCFGDNGVPCSTSNCTNTTLNCSANTPNGWSRVGNEWVGTTNTRNYFYSLTSPTYTVGTNGSIHMRHICDFAELEGGGVIEYRLSNNGSTWTPWSDLITAIDANLYNTRTFNIVGGVDNVLGGRRVFMDQTATQEFTRTVSPALFNQEFVQFRFLFMIPKIDFSGEWRIYEFDYIADQPVSDNLFGYNESTVYQSCIPNLSVALTRPGSYVYEFFTNKTDLANGDAEVMNSTGVWNNYPLPPQDTDYYVRISEDGTSTTRIYSLTIDVQSQVPPFFTVTSDWARLNFNASNDLDTNNEVDVRDILLQISLDECN